jgi:hypothetical protein
VTSRSSICNFDEFFCSNRADVTSVFPWVVTLIEAVNWMQHPLFTRLGTKFNKVVITQGMTEKTEIFVARTPKM